MSPRRLATGRRRQGAAPHPHGARAATAGLRRPSSPPPGNRASTMTHGVTASSSRSSAAVALPLPAALRGLHCCDNKSRRRDLGAHRPPGNTAAWSRGTGPAALTLGVLAGQLGDPGWWGGTVTGTAQWGGCTVHPVLRLGRPLRHLPKLPCLRLRGVAAGCGVCGGRGGALTSPAGSALVPRLQTGVTESLMLDRCCCWLLWLPGRAGSSCLHLLWPIQLGCPTNSDPLLSPPAP